ncbi:hypothetical protein ACE6H2_024325 [Prunus campanulata]
MKYSDVISSWNTLIRALACNGLLDEAWKIFGVMRESDTKPNSHTIISILATCEDETCINIVRAIHGFVIKHGIEADLSLNTALTDMYMNCGDEAAARTLFEGCPSRDVISWNALIASYIINKEIGKAQLLFNRMVSEVNPNSVTIINILSSCTQLASLPLGQCLHAYANRRQFSFGFDLSLANAFISMYARSGSMQNAEKMFKTLPKRNVISWNALITGSMDGGKADKNTAQGKGFRKASWSKSQGLHGSGNIVVKSQKVFAEMKYSDVISWNTLIRALACNGLLDEAWKIFGVMRESDTKPNSHTIISILATCGDETCINIVRAIHGFVIKHGIEADLSLNTALTDMYMNCGDEAAARTVFEGCPSRDVIS